MRWARFGQDRLYVKTPAGVELGYWDDNGQVACLQDEANRPAFDQVIAEYRSGRTNGPAPAGASAESPESAARDIASDHPVTEQSVSDLQVVRWVRFGHDRLYVKTPAHVELGYWDNKGEVAFLENEADRPAFEHAITQYRSGRPDGGAPTSASSDPVAAADQPAHELVELVVVPEPPTVPEWTDLSANRAGASARQQADALRQAAPMRTFMARCRGVKNDERAWRIGAKGEEAVTAQLAKLGDRWRTLHAVSVGNNGSDIDHVIIGPAGIYTINTKNHPKANIWVGGNTFKVNGQRVPYVRNARFEARRTTAFLATAAGFVLPVTGLIAVVGAQGGYTVTNQPPGGDVYVLARKELVKWLHRRPETLTDTQVGSVFDAARRSTTWRR